MLHPLLMKRFRSKANIWRPASRRQLQLTTLRIVHMRGDVPLVVPTALPPLVVGHHMIRLMRSGFYRLTLRLELNTIYIHTGMRIQRSLIAHGEFLLRGTVALAFIVSRKRFTGSVSPFAQMSKVFLLHIKMPSPMQQTWERAS